MRRTGTLLIISLLITGCISPKSLETEQTKPAESIIDINAVDYLSKKERERFDALLKHLKMDVLREMLPESSNIEVPGPGLRPATKKPSTKEEFEQQDKEYAEIIAKRLAWRTKTKATIDKGPGKTRKERAAYENTLLQYLENSVQLLSLQVLERGKRYFNTLIFQYPDENAEPSLRTLVKPALRWYAEDENILTSQLKKTKDPLLKQDLMTAKQRMKYIGGLVTFSAGLSYKHSSRSPRVRDLLFEKTIADLIELIDDLRFSHKHTARLYAARACRELGQYAAAQKAFEYLMKCQIKTLVNEAHYEAARNSAEWSAALVDKGRFGEGETRFADAQRLVEKYESVAGQGLNDTKLMYLRLKKLLLELRMYGLWINTCRARGKKRQVTDGFKQWEKAFGEFFTEYVNQTHVMAKIVKMRPEGGPELTDSPLIALAIASNKIAAAERIKDKPEQNAAMEKLLDEGEKIIKHILDSKEPSAEKIMPDALWEAGRVYWLKRLNFKAGAYFHQMATKYPNHPRAHIAANAAVQFIRGALDDLKSKGQEITTEQRVLLESYLRVYLDRWGRSKEAIARKGMDECWLWEGDMCERLADEMIDNPEEELKYMRRAEEAYGMVPEKSKHYDLARYRLLLIRYQRLLTQPAGKVDKNELQKLKNKIDEYQKKLRAEPGSD